MIAHDVNSNPSSPTYNKRMIPRDQPFDLYGDVEEITLEANIYYFHTETYISSEPQKQTILFLNVGNKLWIIKSTAYPIEIKYMLQQHS